jgi:hypothetical protein
LGEEARDGVQLLQPREDCPGHSTFDAKQGSVRMSGISSNNLSVADPEFRVLVLRIKGKGHFARPNLKNYLETFPNLSSIYFDLVPRNNPADLVSHPLLEPSSKEFHADGVVCKTRHRFKAIFISVTNGNGYSYDTINEEELEAGHASQPDPPLRQSEGGQLSLYHLDIAASAWRAYQYAVPGNYWRGLKQRMRWANSISTKEVSLCIRDIRLAGDVQVFIVSAPRG